MRSATLRRVLPKGEGLPSDIWSRRHHAMLWLLWAHGIAILIFAWVRGYRIDHVILESLIVPAAAIVATVARSRLAQMIAASFGLLSASAILVHLSGGLIEMHFHFFVMVAVVALYQHWIPFLGAIAYVLIHHGVMGSIDPGSVYNHPAAIAQPWKWAGVHALFIFGISVACIVTWRLNEQYLSQRRMAEELLREESRVVETLNEVGKTLSAELDPQSVVQHVTDAATQLTGAQFGAFFYNVVDAEGESYMLYTISGVDRSAFERFPMPRNTPLFARTFAGEDVVRLDDVMADERYGKMPPYYGMPKGHLPVRSYLAVPVRSRNGSVIGGLFFGHEQLARFGSVEERLATGIAAHAAIAIDNANLYESERTARATAQVAQRRVEIMAEASRVLSASLELESSLARFARVVVPALADSCEVYLADGHGSVELAAFASPGVDLAPWRGRSAQYRPDVTNLDDPVVRSIAGRTTVVVDSIDGSDVERWVTDPQARLIASKVGPTSVVVTPLQRRDHVLGAIAFGTNASSTRRFTSADVPLMEELARRVAIAVENAQLYAMKRTAADTLQHSLLPERLPEIPGLDLAARYVPGGPDVDVGGDWYDVVALRDGSLALVMGDVVGRGVTAASLMGQLRNALRAYALEGTEPPVVLERLNDMLCESDQTEGPMATLLYAVYDPETGTLRIANAGHPPPIVMDTDGSVSCLETSLGVPIGAVPGARFSESLNTLRSGATLLLYTDGLVEDRATTLEVGLQSLMESLRSGPVDLDALCDWILSHSPTEGGDDVALLAVRPAAIAERLALKVPARPGMLRPLRATLRRWLAAAGASEEERFEILVAAGEACANAIQHAGAGLDHFEVTAEFDGQVVIEVRDHGHWRRKRPSYGGRGLEIIQRFMDIATVEQTADGSVVRMTRALTGHAVGAER